jgi:hypothetical protein
VEAVVRQMLIEDYLVAVVQSHIYLVGGDRTWHVRCEVDLNRVDFGLSEEFQLVNVAKCLGNGLLNQHLINKVIRLLDR